MSKTGSRSLMPKQIVKAYVQYIDGVSVFTLPSGFKDKYIIVTETLNYQLTVEYKKEDKRDENKPS